MRGKYLYASLAFLAATGALGTARAQSKDGFAASRFEPSERGSEWFALESLDFRGKARPAVGLVAEYQVRPLAIYTSDDKIAYSILRNVFTVHPGASIVFAERFRLSASLPVTLFQDGRAGSIQYQDGTTQSFKAPKDEQAVGDLRLALDARIIGEHNEAFRLAAGLQFWLPTGDRTNYNSDNDIRVAPRVLVAGDIGAFTYAARVNLTFRPEGSFGEGRIGDELGFAASAGVRVADKKLVIGPELFGSTVFGGLPDSKSLFAKRETPAEILLGTHYTIDGDVRLGGGVGTGLGRGFGSPQFHAMLNLEWMPSVEKPKDDVPPPSDRDKDGIIDSEDACIDVAGIRTADPKTNGCPSDKDGDGIYDSEDACIDVAGIRTTDPKTNGCPADTDGDGILDKDDACIDKPGIKTNDPATNGCPPPPDQDKDGILDADDACIDVPGVKSDKKEFNGCPIDIDADKINNDVDACPRMAGPTNKDPKKNGCPNAGLDSNGTIFILEQVQFATGSAVIKGGKPNDDILNAVIKVVKDNSAAIKGLSIEGHTDNKGVAAANKKLSQDRAASVVAWLVKNGKFPKEMFVAVGYGQEKPRDTNDTDAGRQNNRRVEFHVLKEAPASAVAPTVAPKPAAPAAPKPAAPKPAAPKK